MDKVIQLDTEKLKQLLFKQHTMLVSYGLSYKVNELRKEIDDNRWGSVGGSIRDIMESIREVETIRIEIKELLIGAGCVLD